MRMLLHIRQGDRELGLGLEQGRFHRPIRRHVPALARACHGGRQHLQHNLLAQALEHSHILHCLRDCFILKRFASPVDFGPGLATAIVIC